MAVSNRPVRQRHHPSCTAPPQAQYSNLTPVCYSPKNNISGKSKAAEQQLLLSVLLISVGCRNVQQRPIHSTRDHRTNALLRLAIAGPITAGMSLFSAVSVLAASFPEKILRNRHCWLHRYFIYLSITKSAFCSDECNRFQYTTIPQLQILKHTINTHLIIIYSDDENITDIKEIPLLCGMWLDFTYVKK